MRTLDSSELRIAYQTRASDPGTVVEEVRRAESLGFDLAVVSDHVGSGVAPLPTLAAAATVTDTIRLGTMVLNNDMRNPVQLAWDVAAIATMSGGRFELGLGAGHTPQEYAATGIDRDAARIRKERLAESVEIIRALLAGDAVSRAGAHYRLEDAHIESPSEPVPILVGGNGPALLQHAAVHADLIGLQGLARTQPDGHSHTVNWAEEHLRAQLATIAAAAPAGAAPRLSALVQVADITDEADRVLEELCARVEGLSIEDARRTPYLLIGTVEEIVHKMHHCHAEYGIGDFVVRALDQFEPVLLAVR